MSLSDYHIMDDEDFVFIKVNMSEEGEYSFVFQLETNQNTLWYKRAIKVKLELLDGGPCFNKGKSK